MTKKQKIINIVITILCINTLLIGISVFGKNNNYRIESNAKSLKLNDQFTVTLIADLNEPTT